MSNDNQLIAQQALRTIGGKPKVVEYKDAKGESSMDIFLCENSPYDGVTSYATIGLSGYSLGLQLPNGKELRTEFIGACASNYSLFGNIVSSCAFNIINSGFSCSPGTVYPGVISEYYQEFSMRHIFFTTPFLWGQMDDLEMSKKLVTWLMLVPISDEEFAFLDTHARDELEDLFEESQIDIFDLNRRSVV